MQMRGRTKKDQKEEALQTPQMQGAPKSTPAVPVDHRSVGRYYPHSPFSWSSSHTMVTGEELSRELILFDAQIPPPLPFLLEVI